MLGCGNVGLKPFGHEKSANHVPGCSWVTLVSELHVRALNKPESVTSDLKYAWPERFGLESAESLLFVGRLDMLMHGLQDERDRLQKRFTSKSAMAC
jgi:hypothetical protein